MLKIERQIWIATLNPINLRVSQNCNAHTKWQILGFSYLPNLQYCNIRTANFSKPDMLIYLKFNDHNYHQSVYCFETRPWHFYKNRKVANYCKTQLTYQPEIQDPAQLTAVIQNGQKLGLHTKRMIHRTSRITDKMSETSF